MNDMSVRINLWWMGLLICMLHGRDHSECSFEVQGAYFVLQDTDVRIWPPAMLFLAGTWGDKCIF